MLTKIAGVALLVVGALLALKIAGVLIGLNMMGIGPHMIGGLNPWLGIALIICAVALLRYVQDRGEKKDELSIEVVERLEERMSEVERRLTDIQDIVLAIDEKLERRERPVAPDE